MLYPSSDRDIIKTKTTKQMVSESGSGTRIFTSDRSLESPLASPSNSLYQELKRNS